MAKKITKKQFSSARDYIVVLDATLESEKKFGKGYTHFFEHSLGNALVNAEKCAKWETVYSAYIYEKDKISYDGKSIIYTRLLRTNSNGTFTTDISGNFVIALENNESNGQTMSLSHWYCGNKRFVEYV